MALVRSHDRSGGEGTLESRAFARATPLAVISVRTRRAEATIAAHGQASSSSGQLIAEGERHMAFIKKYWYGLLGALVLVVFMALMVAGVIQP